MSCNRLRAVPLSRHAVKSPIGCYLKRGMGNRKWGTGMGNGDRERGMGMGNWKWGMGNGEWGMGNG